MSVTYKVVITSADSGDVTHEVGPFTREDRAQDWAEDFLNRYGLDSDDLSVHRNALIDPDDPDLHDWFDL